MQIQWPNNVADAFLREWYSDKVKVDPVCLGFSLNINGATVEKRLRELGLRKCAGPVATRPNGRPRKVVA